MILYFDTETSGLRPGQICQLSYLMQDEKSTKAKNFFFTVDMVEYGALMVHGFSVDKLKKLSGGKRFYDSLDEIECDFSSADLVVSHNYSFDCMFMRAEFERLNRVFCVKDEFCSMKAMTPVCKLSRSSGVGYKYPKLSELCEFLGISDYEIKSDLKRLFGAEAGFHDARFDTTAVYLAVNYGMDSVECLSRLKEFL